VAYLIDGLIIGLFAIPAIVYLFSGPTEIGTCQVDGNGDIVFGEDGPDNAVCESPTGTTVAVSVLLGLAAGVGGLVYVAKLEGTKGQTLGAQAMGIRVVDIYTQAPIGAGRAIGRYFARILSGFLCGLGYLWMLWDDQAQTWHDKLSNSVVIRA
jgi:uncharacterized RDD family membrane protein YckC